MSLSKNVPGNNVPLHNVFLDKHPLEHCLNNNLPKTHTIGKECAVFGTYLQVAVKSPYLFRSDSVKKKPSVGSGLLAKKPGSQCVERLSDV